VHFLQPLTAPFWSWYCPASQLLQPACAAEGWKLPKAQGAQVPVASLSAKRPRAQGRHERKPLAEVCDVAAAGVW
jgi:hypothetical protein